MCHRDKTLTTIRELCNDQVLATNSDLWNGRARNELMKYEEHLYDYFKRGLSDHEQKVWTFWNAVFYCGTIYTTIGESILRQKLVYFILVWNIRWNEKIRISRLSDLEVQNFCKIYFCRFEIYIFNYWFSQACF